MSAGVLIAGGGLAGQRCAEALRRAGFDGPIRMICAERHLPYDRPPLSKELLLGADAPAEPTFRPEGWYADHDVDVRVGARATALHPDARTLVVSDGTHLPYDHLLIATGSRPLGLPGLDGRTNVTALRTLEDARRLRGALERRERLAVIGGGFVGQEVAASARAAGCDVTLIEAMPWPLGHVVGHTLGRWFADLHREEGVRVLLGHRVAAVYGDRAVTDLRLDDDTLVECDQVVVGIGVVPDLDWVAGSGLDPRGIAVDARGATGAPGVFAAGDAAATLDPVLRRHVPGGHWESAARHGALAARAILGLPPAPAPIASFWSDQYGTRIQQIGHTGLADGLRIDGDPAARDFTALYTRGDRPVAALLVGRPHALPEARRMITEEVAQPGEAAAA